jgi:hypothetical protein
MDLIKNRGMAVGRFFSAAAALIIVIFVYLAYGPILHNELIEFSDGMGANPQIRNHTIDVIDACFVLLALVCFLIMLSAARDKDYPSMYRPSGGAW